MDGRFSGIANPNPHLPGDACEQEIRRCKEELGFVGIKIRPMAHGVNPLGLHGRRVFALADELGLPVIVHTGAGITWAPPALRETVASEHSSLKIAVAHAGAMILAAEALALAERHNNV